MNQEQKKSPKACTFCKITLVEKYEINLQDNPFNFGNPDSPKIFKNVVAQVEKAIQYILNSYFEKQLEIEFLMLFKNR